MLLTDEPPQLVQDWEVPYLNNGQTDAMVEVKNTNS